MGNQSTKIKMGNQTNKIDLGKIETEAMQSIELKVGQSSIKIDQMGVTIKGMMIKVEAQIQCEVKAVMTQVNGDAMTHGKGRHRDDQLIWAAHRRRSIRKPWRSPRSPNSAKRRWRWSRPDLHPLEFVALLMEKALFPDAVRFIAHALPKREAVWWAMGVRAARGRRESAAEDQGARSTPPRNGSPSRTKTTGGRPWPPPKRPNWAPRPDAPDWRHFSAAAAWRRPKRRRCRPGEFLAAKAVSGAVIFAAVAKEPEKAPEKFRSFVAQGVEVTNRVKLWEPEVEENVMGMPASRITDMHVCPMVTGIVPHVGGPILPPGAVTVLIGGLPAARVADMAVCVGPPDVIVLGSFTVLTMGMPQARIGDMTAHGGAIVLGCPTVLVG